MCAEIELFPCFTRALDCVVCSLAHLSLCHALERAVADHAMQFGVALADLRIAHEAMTALARLLHVLALLSDPALRVSG
jgi:hypothetical protein